MTRPSRPRICIAHQTVMGGDAIGNDIAGAYRLLERCGYDVTILCEHVHPDIEARYRVIVSADLVGSAAGFDMLLYHHSIHWPAGEDLLHGFAGAIVVKYHNITPAEYFAPYAEIYRVKCAEGREQTARVARLPGISRWQCASHFNSLEIRELGVGDDNLGVVPPFNRVDELFRETHDATYGLARPFVAMFVGRRVPNKGHVHILRTLAAWRELFPETELRCRIIGPVDAQLSLYYDELAALESTLGLGSSVEWREHVSEATLAAAFRSSHVYLNLSEHEGFCVPLIEAQAVGLPTISADATASPETAGPGQIVVPVPRSGPDYDLIAGLLHEVCVSWKLRRALVQAGCRNVFQRFTSQMVESRFLAEMEPVLRTLEA